MSPRSRPFKPSMRSQTYRNTLMGYDESSDLKITDMRGVRNEARKFVWSDHLLAVFCVHRRPRTKRPVPDRPPPYGDRDLTRFHRQSPWVLPVYVLSTERDEYRHLIPKEAKCTFDTGNLQGNIVSKAFLVDVLGYSETDFQELLKEEGAGGMGITGHKLIPTGAIDLTWYYSNSTRVFRDMRFLISEHPMFDLVIGAHSIEQNRILDIPNFMDSEAGYDNGIVFPKVEPTSDRLKELESKLLRASAAGMEDIYAQMEDAGPSNVEPNQATEEDDLYGEVQREREKVYWDEIWKHPDQEEGYKALYKRKYDKELPPLPQAEESHKRINTLTPKIFSGKDKDKEERYKQ